MVYAIGREVDLPKFTASHSTHKATPGSGKPVGTPGYLDSPGVHTTEVEIGKTANLYSESLATFEHYPRTYESNATQLRTGDSYGTETGWTGVTDTQMTGMTETSWSGSEEDEEAEQPVSSPQRQSSQSQHQIHRVPAPSARSGGST